MDKTSKKKGKPPATKLKSSILETPPKPGIEKTKISAGNKVKAIKIDVSDKKQKKDSKSYLYLIMALNLLLCAGYCYVFDFPQALEDALLHSLKVDTIKISMLYSIYSLPNIFFSPITGYIIEKIGCNNSAILYCALIFAGQAVVYYGIQIENYWVVLSGRGIYGIGAEGITILQLTINELWFYGSYLSVGVALTDVFGILSIMAGNFFNSFIFTATRKLSTSFFISGIICFISFLAAVFYYHFHNKYIGIADYHENESGDQSNNDSLKLHLNDSNTQGLILDRADSFAPIAPRRKMTAEDMYFDEKIEFGFKSIKFFNATYWVLCICFLFLANCYYQFTNMATDLLVVRFGYQFEEAKQITIAPEIAFIIVSPFVSKIIEVRGWKPFFILLSSLLFCGSYCFMYFLESQKSYFVYLCFTTIGMGFGIVSCALHSSVALSIPKSGVSMGYSIMTTIENAGLSTLPLYFGYIAKSRSIESYNECILSLIILSFLGTICSIVLLIYDTNKTQLLTLPENSKAVRRLRKQIDSDFIQKSFHASMLAGQDERIPSTRLIKAN